METINNWWVCVRERKGEKGRKRERSGERGVPMGGEALLAEEPRDP